MATEDTRVAYLLDVLKSLNIQLVNTRFDIAVSKRAALNGTLESLSDGDLEVFELYIEPDIHGKDAIELLKALNALGVLK